jgi:hypothetical protein
MTRGCPLILRAWSFYAVQRLSTEHKCYASQKSKSRIANYDAKKPIFVMTLLKRLSLISAGTQLKHIPNTKTTVQAKLAVADSECNT